MNPSFNLIDEPWINCITTDGDNVEFSLLDILVHSPEIREIADPSPLVVVALHRLLLAILHRVFGPVNWAAWEELWNASQWPREPLAQYFDQWHERFDLFHPLRPFFQSEDERVKPKSILNLVHSSNNNPTLFEHQTEEEGIALTASQAARELLASQAFHMAGLSGLDQKFTDAPCARGVIFLAQGRNLFETLALNFIGYPDPDGQPIRTTVDDRPAWEMDDPFDPSRDIPLGYLDYLTWHNLRVKLLPEIGPDGVTVRHVKVGPGLVLNPDLRDPMKLYTADRRGQGIKVVRFLEDRALWRDTHTLLALRKESNFPPASLNWLAELVNEGYLPNEARYRYRALGMSSHQAKVYFYREERFPIRLAYLQKQELVGYLEQVIRLADEVSSALNWCLKTLAKLIIAPDSDQPNSRQPDEKRDIQPLLNQWGAARRYWGELDAPFWQLLDSLPDQPDEALTHWKDVLRTAAQHTLEQAENLAGNDAISLKAAVHARRQLNGRLKKVLQ